MILRLILIGTAIFSTSPTTALPAADVISATVSQDPTPPQRRYETASTRIATAENEQWFSELISLNPGCTVVVVGQGIAVSKTGGLTLPAGPVPADVNLQ